MTEAAVLFVCLGNICRSPLAEAAFRHEAELAGLSATADSAGTADYHVGDTAMLLVARGDARLDNAKTKAALGGRPRMLAAEETLALTGHAIGGVCPFGLATDLPIVCDRSLLAYATVFPAAGSQTSSIEVAPERLAELVSAQWVDICRLPE